MRDRIIHKALLSRKVENRLLSLFGEGKLSGTVHTCIGQEFSGAVVSEFIHSGDAIFSNHRCHGHFLSYTNDIDGLISEIIGKESGVCRGWGGSQHLYKDKFFSSGIQGGILPTAAGCAFAFKLNSQKNMSIAFIGDGTLGEGSVYETFNIISKWSLPMLVILENNQYAQSTSIKETMAGSITDRAKAFGITTFEGDTWNWEQLAETTQQAFDIVRNEVKPVFLLINTYRLKAHSKGDDNRDKSEVSHYESLDPLTKILEANENNIRAEESKIDELIEMSVEKAEQHGYSPIPADLVESALVPWEQVGQLQNKRVVNVINAAFKEAMGEDDRVIFLGEDVMSPYGGAFKVSNELSAMYPERVFNTPISESTIAGIGCGLALEGFFPLVEIMFGDFISLTFDQILNHISKFEMMYHGHVKVNMIIRTPMGGGRGYGPTHSQTLEKHFLGIPGLTVVAINHLSDPGIIYKSLIKSKNLGPFLFIENKQLYGANLLQSLPVGFSNEASVEMFPVSLIKPASAAIDVTIVAYGGLSTMLPEIVDELFQQHGIVAQVFCPTKIYPFHVSKYLDVFEQSEALVIIEEGQGFAAFGSELIAQLSEQLPGHLKKIKRINPPAVCIPSSGQMEKEVLPGKTKIISLIKELINEN